MRSPDVTMDATTVATSGRRRSNRVTAVLVLVAAAIALCVRWIGLTLPPLAFSAHRQLTDAQMARGYWQHIGGSLPAYLPDGYQVWVPRALEPPVVQGLGALTYVVVGHEALWLPRALLATAWVVTGLAVWGLVRRLVGTFAAWVAVGLWLFLPYAVVFSRSFLPDVLMLCLVVAGLWALVRDDDAPSRRSWWLAGALCGAALFVKPTAALAVLPAMLALAWVDHGRAGLFSARAARRVGLVLLPAAAYWVAAAVFGWLGDQSQGRFDPSMFTTTAFWQGWFDMATRVVPWPLAVLGVAGLVWAPRRARFVGAALLAGYLLHGLAFSHHTPTHDYYHVLLLPPVLIGVGALAARARDLLVGRDVAPVVAVGAVAVVVAVLGLSGPRPYPYVETALPPALRGLPAEAEAAGDALDHTEPVLLVSRGYGIAQQYYGYLKGPFWPLSADIAAEGDDGPTAAERLEILGRSSQLSLWGVRAGPIDWVLVTEPLLLEEQPELAQLLATEFTPVASGPGWTAYQRRGTGSTASSAPGA